MDDMYTQELAGRGITRAAYAWDNLRLRYRFMRDTVATLGQAMRGELGPPTIKGLAHRLAAVVSITEANVRDFGFHPLVSAEDRERLTRARALLTEAERLLEAVRDGDAAPDPLDRG